MRRYAENLKKERNDSWYTPLHFINKLGFFDLDPCGHKNHLTAKKIIQYPEENGLSIKWEGRVWLNPPYSNPKPWIDKLINYHGIALVFARTDTKWLQDALSKADSVFFLSGRIKFLDSNFNERSFAGAPSLFLSFGERPIWPFDGFLAK